MFRMKSVFGLVFSLLLSVFWFSQGCLPPPLPEDPPEVTIALDEAFQAGRPQQPGGGNVLRAGSPIRFTLSVKHFHLEREGSHLHEEHTSFEKASGGYAKAFLGDRFLFDVRSKNFIIIPPRSVRGKQNVVVELVDHDGQSFSPKVRGSLEIELR